MECMLSGALPEVCIPKGGACHGVAVSPSKATDCMSQCDAWPGVHFENQYWHDLQHDMAVKRMQQS